MATYGHTFTSGDTVTPTKLNNARTVSDIVNADISASAAIAGTKISPAFGAQDITVGSGVRSITNTTNHALTFGTNNSERMRINSGGDVLIGTTSAIDYTTDSLDGYSFADGAALTISRPNLAGLAIRRRTVDGKSVLFYRSTSEVGSISVTTTATAYNTSSDYRLKDNATPLIGGLATINQLSPVEFTWKSNGSIGRGFIAHELQAVVPEAVTGAKDAVDADGKPEYQGVDAAKLVPYLVSAIKELKNRVEALEVA